MTRIALHVPVPGRNRRYNPQVVRVVADMTHTGASVREIVEHLEAITGQPIPEYTVWAIRKRGCLRADATHEPDHAVVQRLVAGDRVAVRHLTGHRLSVELVEAIRVLVGYGLNARQIHDRLRHHVTYIGLRRWLARHRDELRGAA